MSTWIDYNRNGVFELNERVMAVSNSASIATAAITVTGAARLGPTRMRVISIGGYVANSDPCTMFSLNTEVEDYTVEIRANPQPPVADFSVNSSISCTGTEVFKDISINVPTSWHWNFGDPASGAANTSTQQNPSHVFSTPGLYTITLITANQYGSDTITKVNYINFNPANSFCTTVVMPAIGIGPTATACSGTIYDPGGTGQYPNESNSIITIAPTGAVSVRLDFTSFNLQSNTDELYIYDGSSIASPLIGVYSGNTLPNGGSITSTGPALTLRFFSDLITRLDGFAATWTCTMPMVPVANFKADVSTICTGQIPFQDLSVNLPTSWQWDFGDPASGAANTSTLRNPSHTYSTTVPGSYTVRLIACNAMGCDTITKVNYINMAVPCLTYCSSQGHTNTNNYIANVSFGNLNNTSSAEPNGYGNYTTLSSNIVLGTTTPVSVRTGNNNFNFGWVTIWIDLNKDGIFQVSEKLFHGAATRAAHPDPYIAAGNITIPNTTQAGTTRMRIVLSGDYQQNDPCVSNLAFGETEDYAVTLIPNALPLAGNFSASLNAICTGTVQFKDASVNGATSWLWNFGNPASGAANTSTLQNPSHNYPTTASASYDVSLIVCRGTQCDTITRTNYINVPSPCQTYCLSDGHYNQSRWISNVTVGGMSNSTAIETDGYGNYTNLRAALEIGSAVNPVSVTIGNSSSSTTKDVQIWIDFNKNGIFEQSEKAFSGQTIGGNPMVASGNISVPVSAQTGFTRMRVMMLPGYTSLSGACINNFSDVEVEDYTVNLLPNAQPVTANFKPDMTNICSGGVKFMDASLNGPSSWHWDFGDPASGAANTSTLQNPTHNYSAATPGSYTVTLIACKAGQCDTITKTNLIKTTVPCRTYCASSGHNNAAQWISNVAIGTINNLTGAETNGYGNYTFLSTDLMLGVPNPVTVTLANSGVNLSVYIWIDFNQDGIFQTNERIFNKVSQTMTGGTTQATANILLPGYYLTGVTRMRVLMSPHFFVTDPCPMNFLNVEVEDYLVNIIPNPNPVVANFTATRNGYCNNTVQFFDASVNGATSWLWNFGDPASGVSNSSTLEQPSHTYPASPSASYDVTLIACKGIQCDTITKANAVNIVVPCPAYYLMQFNSNINQWISNVTIGSINNSSGKEPDAYTNFFYESTTAHSGLTGIPVSVTLGNGTGTAFYVKIWVDFNRDGTFQVSEQVFNNLTVLNAAGKWEATGSFVIPVSALYGATRMRVSFHRMAAYNEPCPNNRQDIETEDYTIIIQQNPVPPISAFTANKLITCDGQVAFTDESTNLPASWAWNFGDPGSGAANTSTLRNPIHTFSAPGIYSVSLVTVNAFGRDSLVKTNYITFDPANQDCRTVLMPVSGPIISTYSSCTGFLYDNGGPSANYADNANGTIIIAPPNPTGLTISFTSFDTQLNYDFLRIYDGIGASASFLGSYSGNVLPNNGNAIVSSSGAFTIQFITNQGVNYSGFEAFWDCNGPVGLRKDLQGVSFEAYPSPSSGIVNLKLTERNQDAFNLEIMNVLGKVLLKQEVKFPEKEALSLDLSQFSKGVYLIRIKNDNTSAIRKILID